MRNPSHGSVAGRTRGKWENFYRDWNKEKKARESGGDEGGNVGRSSGCMCYIEGSNSLNTVSHETSREKNGNSTRERGHDDFDLDLTGETSDKMCSVSDGLRGKKKFDEGFRNNGDDNEISVCGVQSGGENVVSAGSCSKPPQSMPNEGGAICNHCGCTEFVKARPQTRPLNKLKDVPFDAVFVDLEDSKESSDSEEWIVDSSDENNETSNDDSNEDSETNHSSSSGESEASKYSVNVNEDAADTYFEEYEGSGSPIETKDSQEDKKLPLVILSSSDEIKQEMDDDVDDGNYVSCTNLEKDDQPVAYQSSSSRNSDSLSSALNQEADDDIYSGNYVISSNHEQNDQPLTHSSIRLHGWDSLSYDVNQEADDDNSGEEGKDQPVPLSTRSSGFSSYSNEYCDNYGGSASEANANKQEEEQTVGDFSSSADFFFAEHCRDSVQEEEDVDTNCDNQRGSPNKMRVFREEKEHRVVDQERKGITGKKNKTINEESGNELAGWKRKFEPYSNDAYVHDSQDDDGIGMENSKRGRIGEGNKRKVGISGKEKIRAGRNLNLTKMSVDPIQKESDKSTSRKRNVGVEKNLHSNKKSIEKEADETTSGKKKTRVTRNLLSNEMSSHSIEKEADERTPSRKKTNAERNLESDHILADSLEKESDETNPGRKIMTGAEGNLDSNRMYVDSQEKEADQTIPSKKNTVEAGNPEENNMSVDSTHLASKKEANSTIKMLVDFIEKEVEGSSKNVASVDCNASPLPLKFRFEDEEPPLPEKSEWEKEIDALFADLNMGLREDELGCMNPPMVGDDGEDAVRGGVDKSPEACCHQGEHQPILDEEIGIKCKYCSVVLVEIEDILPQFYIPPPRRQNGKNFGESRISSSDQLQFQDCGCENPGYSSVPGTGTVWDLVPNTKNGMYPHQQEGFEFMWKNIAGDIFLDNLKKPLSNDGKGCIISHAPGTGKTRLTIVFLQAFMNLYPKCRPLIIAPRGMLLTWEDEFRKWGVKIPFHNLNDLELSAEENCMSNKIVKKMGSNGKSRDNIRLVKIICWLTSKSILGVSYPLFEKIAGKRGGKGLHDEMRKYLLEYPGLLVLDEGHNPRSDNSLTWKALTNVATSRRIMLSGTPFQNNFEELYNTICLVNPKFADELDKNHPSCRRGRENKTKVHGRWRTLTKFIGETTEKRLMKLRSMINPFVHVHKGTILQESLPGLRDSLVFLRPTELQKSLLEIASKGKSFLQEVCLVSLISVHPSLVAQEEIFSAYKSEIGRIESTIDAGVKTMFVIKLIRLADALAERVLVFSEYLDPLLFIKQQLQAHFSWKEGREVLYMDGKLDENQRQNSIHSFNTDSSEAKVLLASQRACSEGINLVGASRVILLDTAWNPSVERQAISRAYRLGQKKVVHVYQLITSGTVEVQKYSSQAQKDRISELIFRPTDGSFTSHSPETSKIVYEDKVFESLAADTSFRKIFEKIVHQPKAFNLVETFDFTDLQR